MNVCKKCGNKNNYNFALNIGLCDLCIGAELERLQTELDKYRWIPVSERLPEVFENIRHPCSKDVLLLTSNNGMHIGYYDKQKSWIIYGSREKPERYQALIACWKPIILPTEEKMVEKKNNDIL